jgi:hypothetical protein
MLFGNLIHPEILQAIAAYDHAIAAYSAGLVMGRRSLSQMEIFLRQRCVDPTQNLFT